MKVEPRVDFEAPAPDFRPRAVIDIADRRRCGLGTGATRRDRRFDGPSP
jgi:hypothetical protein